MIRLAKEDDLDRLVQMGLRFRGESSYRTKISANPEKMRETAKILVDKQSVLISEHGMLGFVIYDHFLSGEKTAGEVFWWVDPDHRGEGVRLLRQMERQARQVGAKNLQMIAPTERVGQFYERLGYEYVESSYQKAL